jgi:hypothetical protein
MSGAGSWSFKRDGLKLAKPVSEVKASSDEDADGHIEEMQCFQGFERICLSSFYSPTESENNGQTKRCRKSDFRCKSGG